MDLLLSVAEEAAALDTRRQGLFVKKGMQPQAPAVFTILGKVLQSCLATPGDTRETPVWCSLFGEIQDSLAKTTECSDSYL